MAYGTGFRFGSRLGTGAKAGVAGFGARNGDIGFFAEYRFLEFNGHGVLQISAALRSVRITASAAAEEHIKNIAKPSEISSTAKAAAHTLVRIDMPVLVIPCALLAVAQDIVCFLHFLEFRLCVAGLIDVRVVLARQLAVCLLHFII
ncbi:hypothetical protein D3C80_1675720 [compost metagenome]